MTELHWLQSTAFQSLLNHLVDKLDSAEQRGSASAQTISLNAASWPALYRAAKESDKEFLWEQLRDLVKLGWLQVTPLTASRSETGYDEKPRIKVLDIAAIRKATGRMERQKTAVERWREALALHLDAPDEIKRAAGDYCIDMPDREMAEVVKRLNVLKDLASRPMLLREVSARLFWGMSKVLDNRTGLVAVLLGLDECPFLESPVQLQVYLPHGGFCGVLFIENLMSFEKAIRAKGEAFSKLALVYASGFKGSAARLRTPEAVSLFFSHKGELGGDRIDYFESWLHGKNIALPVSFWGDLDWSGMRILAAMRNNFPNMKAWEPGYQPMLQSLLAGQGHSPEASDKKGQRPMMTSGCKYADTHLIPALSAHGRFVDQEQFTL
ncbi:Wadjet anti-phage system protein JetD domain-containing protein [Limnohabitans sp.]|uniref:Wadjet anti-phage system protein JetD domain-containing protein n=1 Tax=Limnohabitans sp. TaxID=1907725 RepID=UPI00286EF315|nr:Wadjet anti-phage system protein JetD domain-containing protein [Limnohabitans sp.]